MHGVTEVVWYGLVLLVSVTNVRSDKLKQADTVISLYEAGTLAYLEERYPECVEKLEQSLEKYRSHMRNTQNCRLKCRHESDASEPLFPVDVENLRFHEKNIRNTLCLINCKIRSNGNNDNIDADVQKIFEERRPYEYLHLCYYKVNDKQKAASAAFTFLVAHPDHKVMTKNLQQYSELPEVNVNDVINFEAKDYVYLYTSGADAYERKEWDTTINYMEESLVSYLHSEEECRAQCEGPFDPGWYPDFVPAIANHFTYVLKCKRDCKRKLGSVNLNYYDDLLPSHYNYLQYAYFKRGSLHEACEAVASYLLLVPEDKDMLANMIYYQKLPKIQENYFKAREEAVRYAQRDAFEKRILDYIKNEFSFNKSAKRRKMNFRARKNNTDLGGSNRISFEGVASWNACKKLLHIADNFMILNDGYFDINDKAGAQSPHTKNEQFEGITLSRITFLVYIGLLKPSYLKLMLDLTQEIRTRLMENFKIEEDLYFSYTHLVCRSALPGSPKSRSDLSHRIHADNCNLIDDTCEKKPPAFYWRDYSAILYLNDNFEGGEFVFASDPMGENIQSTISPICGRMVAFSSGSENLHGVRAVTRGKRCALAVWFTLDPKYQEFNRDISHHMLHNNITFHQYSEEITNIFK